MQPYRRLPPPTLTRSPGREPDPPASPEPEEPFLRELEREIADEPDPFGAGAGVGGLKRGRDWGDVEGVGVDRLADSSAAAQIPQVAASVRALEALVARAPRRPAAAAVDAQPARTFDRGLRNAAVQVDHPPDGDYQAGPSIRLTLLASGRSTLTVAGQRHEVTGSVVATLALLVANHDRVVLLDDLHRLTGSSIDTAGRNVTRLRKLGLAIHCDRVHGTNPPVTAGYRLDTQGVPEGHVPAALAPLQRRSRPRRASQAQAAAGVASSSASSLPGGNGSPNR